MDSFVKSMDPIVKQYNLGMYILKNKPVQYLDMNCTVKFSVIPNSIGLYISERLVAYITTENNDDIPDIIKNIINELRSYKSEDPSHVEEPVDIWLPRFMEFINANYQTN